MALYELRTYTLRVGAMSEAVKLYQDAAFPPNRQLVLTWYPLEPNDK